MHSPRNTIAKMLTKFYRNSRNKNNAYLNTIKYYNSLNCLNTSYGFNVVRLWKRQDSHPPVLKVSSWRWLRPRCPDFRLSCPRVRQIARHLARRIVRRGMRRNESTKRLVYHRPRVRILLPGQWVRRLLLTDPREMLEHSDKYEVEL